VRRLVVGAVVIAGAARLFPVVLRRVMAPPTRPQPHTPSDLGLPEVSIALRSRSGTDLHAWFVPAGGRAPAVVVLHGWGANASLMLPLAPHLHGAGFHSLFLDARNHGRSDQDDFVSMPRFAEDLDVAVDWLLGHPEVSTVGIIGHSVGGGAAILAASRRDDLGAVVSVAAFAHPGEAMARSAPMNRFPSPMRAGIFRTIERTIGYRFDEIAPRATIAGVRAPLLLAHGSADRVVPITDLEALTAAAPHAATLIVEGAGHASLEAFGPAIPRIIGFLSQHLSDDGTGPPPPTA
jgi:pimeloyl-ACP methyl ester carboxylesterase